MRETHAYFVSRETLKKENGQTDVSRETFKDNVEQKNVSRETKILNQ